MKYFQDKSILIATGNPGKRAEIEELFADSGYTLIGTDSCNEVLDVEESGATYRDNAVLKARAYAMHFGLPSLADDSGLEVATLGGRPGVHSARYVGPDVSFDDRIRSILREMGEAADDSREARFVCSMALSDAKGRILVCEEGTCKGLITHAARGSGGFGYDPIFQPDGFELTFGELDEAIKNKISHRADAIRKIIRYLLAFTAL